MMCIGEKVGEVARDRDCPEARFTGRGFVVQQTDGKFCGPHSPATLPDFPAADGRFPASRTTDQTRLTPTTVPWERAADRYEETVPGLGVEFRIETRATLLPATLVEHFAPRACKFSRELGELFGKTVFVSRRSLERIDQRNRTALEVANIPGSECESVLVRRGCDE